MGYFFKCHVAFDLSVTEALAVQASSLTAGRPLAREYRRG